MQASEDQQSVPEGAPPLRENGGRQVTVREAIEALDTLLADPRFRASDRNRRFLRFVAEKALTGNDDAVKAYTIAVDVFGRGADFDPILDPIVRVEATRLRSTLTAYYAGPGRDEAVRISLPKGGYVPVFEPQEPPGEADEAAPQPEGADIPETVPDEPAGAEPAAKPAMPSRFRLDRIRYLAAGLAVLAALVAVGWLVADWDARPVISEDPVVLVRTESAASADVASGQMAAGFARSLTQAISRFDGIQVHNLPSELSTSSALDLIDRGVSERRAVYILNSGLRQQGQVIRFWWELRDARNGEVIWADATDRPASGEITMAVEDEVASKVATMIGQPQGLVAMRQLETELLRPTKGYGCVLRARAYYAAISESLHRDVRACLEETVAAVPDYADAWAMLALVYLDEDRNAFNRRSTSADALERAVGSARRAAELAPNSETAQEALLLVYHRKGDFEAAFAAGRRALEINPYNPSLAASLGARLFARGYWDEGAALVQKAVDQSLVVLPTDRAMLVIDYYRREDYAGALKQVEMINAPNFYPVPVLRAAIYAQLGNKAEAEKNVRALLAIRPNYAAEFRDDLRSRRFTEVLIDKLAEGLKKAGLAVQ